MTKEKVDMLTIGTLTALFKSFTVLYFLFLPILFSLQVISAQDLGYIGSFLIVGILSGAFVLSHLPHAIGKLNLLKLVLVLLLVASLFLFGYTSIFILYFVYILVGVASGIGLTIVSELAADITTKGNRFGIFANIAMFMDIVRIMYPLLVGVIYVGFGFNGLVVFTQATVALTGFLVMFLSRKHTLLTDAPISESQHQLPLKLLRNNSPFSFTILLEFVDAFASSQLFIFLPLLLLFKNFSIESALSFQSIVFLGYLSGRWFVSLMAKKLNGFVAVGIAEIGMVATIILLLIIPASLALYPLCFVLGVFTRGTSPVIKALIFDELEQHQARQGSALYTFFGEVGSALAQLAFGILFAWYGAPAPFIMAAVVAGVAAVISLLYPVTYHKK